MDITINTHYGETTNGVITENGKTGGTFYPEGAGKPEEFFFGLTPVGKLHFDPETGRPIPNMLGEWDGDGCAVRILERGGGNGTRVVLCAWIAATDCQGTVHTAEVPLETGAGFGFVSLTVD
jgi:hypothetical protein